MTTIEAAATTPPHAGEGGLRGRIRRHPLLAFFALANGLSWTAWIPYILSGNGVGVLDLRFPELLGTSQLLGMLPGAYLGPITAALVVTAIADGRDGLRRWVGRLWRWRVRWHWYAVALLGVPVGLLVTGTVFSGGDLHAPSVAALAAYVPMLLLQMVTTGLAEEPGWRDFALPRLQRRFGPLGAAAILGPMWTIWHLPLFLTDWGGYPAIDWTTPVAFAVFCIAFNVVMSWLFNRTGESLPLSMLLHVSANAFASVLWLEVFPSLGEGSSMPAMATGATVVAIVLIVVTRGTLGYPPALAARAARVGAGSRAQEADRGA